MTPGSPSAAGRKRRYRVHTAAAPSGRCREGGRAWRRRPGVGRPEIVLAGRIPSGCRRRASLIGAASSAGAGRGRANLVYVDEQPMMCQPRQAMEHLVHGDERDRADLVSGGCRPPVRAASSARTPPARRARPSDPRENSRNDEPTRSPRTAACRGRAGRAAMRVVSTAVHGRGVPDHRPPRPQGEGRPVVAGERGARLWAVQSAPWPPQPSRLAGRVRTPRLGA